MLGFRVLGMQHISVAIALLVFTRAAVQISGKAQMRVGKQLHRIPVFFLPWT